MKRVTIALLLLFSITTFAQEGINYKALIKDNLGAVVASQSIDVRFTIIADTGATPVYSENHASVSTDANGIVILTIGGGGSVLTGVFSDIAWGSDTHSLKVEIDIEQDSSFVDMGTTQFMSVPYAMQATTATTALNVQASGTTPGDMQYWNGSSWEVVDATPNEGAALQMIGGVPTWIGGTPPPTVPDAPTIGTAVAGNGEASIPFTAPLYDGGSPITLYTATSSPDGITGTLSQAGSGSIIVSGLANGAAYTFSVTATNAIGTSSPSSASNSVTTLTVPDAPTIGTAVAGNGEASIPFTAPLYDGGSSITLYTATSSPDGITGTLSQAGSGSIIVSGLANGAAYTFSVTATNAIGTSSPSSASNSVTTLTVPDAPTIGTAVAGNGEASIPFTAPLYDGGSPITLYTATSSPDGITGTLSQAGSGSIIVSGLANGAAYTFSVTATNAIGTSSPSSASNSVTTPTVPDAPTIGTAVAGNGEVSIPFTAPLYDGGSPITLYTATSSPGGITGTLSQAGSGSIIVSGLANGAAYTFSVTATNALGTSSPSSASNSVTVFTILEVTSPTGKIWMDRNLGATQVATSIMDAASYGDLYQRGRGADGHQLRTSSTTANLSSSDPPGHGDFILTTLSPYDWRSPQNDNLWQGVNGVNNPCPTGYRLPTEVELDAERLSWSSQNRDGAFASPLKLPVAGRRDHGNGSLLLVGSSGSYWSSTVNSTSSRSLIFGLSYAYMTNRRRAYGISVRCIKD